MLAKSIQAQNCSSFDIIAASSANTISCGGSATLTASPSVSSPFTVSYVWSPATNLNPSNGLAPSVVASPKSTTTYTVVATRSDGCSAARQVSVAVTNNIAITQSNPSSLLPWITSASKMNLTVTGLSNPVWSENEAAIALQNTSSATVTVRSTVSHSTPMPNTTITVTGTNVNPGCPASASVTVLGVNAFFLPNGLVTNCDGNNTKVLTAPIPPAGVLNYRFDWYRLTTSSPVLVGSGTSLSVTKTGLGTGRYYAKVVPINTALSGGGNESTVLADVRFSTQATPVTQGTSPANAIPLTCGVPVTVDNLCYTNTHTGYCAINNEGGDIFFTFPQAPILPFDNIHSFPPPHPYQAVTYLSDICADFDVEALLKDRANTCDRVESQLTSSVPCYKPFIGYNGLNTNTYLLRGYGNEIMVVQSMGRGLITVTYKGLNNGSNNCVGARKAVVNSDHTDENSEINANIVLNNQTNHIDVKLPSEAESKLTILNMLGQEVKSGAYTGASYQVPFAELSNGVYLININQNGVMFNTKVNINQ